jgi:hypothetical protein
MEIAGMLYGISLNTDGTTKVVAQRLEDSAQTGSAMQADATPSVVANEALAAPPVG